MHPTMLFYNSVADPGKSIRGALNLRFSLFVVGGGDAAAVYDLSFQNLDFDFQ